MNVKEGWQYLREHSAAFGVQSNVCSNGEEVISIADLGCLVERIRENAEAVDRRGVQVTSQDARLLRGQHEHITGLDAKIRNLAFHGEPASAFESS